MSAAHSVGEGPSDGVYGGRVSTESGPWCLGRGMVMGARGMMEGVSCGGVAACWGSAIGSVQQGAHTHTQVRQGYALREKHVFALSLSILTSPRRDGNNLRHQMNATRSTMKQT